MSLTVDAIKHIEAQALVAANQQIETSGHTLAVLPEGVKLHNLEQYRAGRDRFRATFATHSLADFSKYATSPRSSGFDAAGFIDQDAMSAKVIFNLGNTDDAGHGDDTATLTLKPTAAFAALQGVIGKALEQQALAEFLEDWAPNLSATAAGAPLELLSAINAVRRMSIKATAQRDSVVGDLSNSRSSMDEIEARSLDTLPTQFTFTTIPYEGLQPAHIDLRLSVITGRDAPLLKLRWVAEEAHREAIAREFKEVLTKEVGGLIPLSIGTFSLAK